MATLRERLQPTVPVVRQNSPAELGEEPLWLRYPGLVQLLRAVADDRRSRLRPSESVLRPGV